MSAFLVVTLCLLLLVIAVTAWWRKCLIEQYLRLMNDSRVLADQFRAMGYPGIADDFHRDYMEAKGRLDRMLDGKDKELV